MKLTGIKKADVRQDQSASKCPKRLNKETLI